MPADLTRYDDVLALLASLPGLVPALRVVVVNGSAVTGGWDDHSDKETANLNWLPRLAKRAAVLIYRLGSRESNVPRT